VSVRNVPPHIVKMGSATVRRGFAFRRRVVFTDPGADTWRAVVAWGDGSARSRRPLGSAKSFLIRHVFKRTGALTVSVRVYDRHGASSLARFRVAVRR